MNEGEKRQFVVNVKNRGDVEKMKIRGAGAPRSCADACSGSEG